MTDISAQTMRRAIAALDIRIEQNQYPYPDQIAGDRAAREELTRALNARGCLAGPWHGEGCDCEPGTHAKRCPVRTPDYPDDCHRSGSVHDCRHPWCVQYIRLGFARDRGEPIVHGGKRIMSLVDYETVSNAARWRNGSRTTPKTTR